MSIERAGDAIGIDEGDYVCKSFHPTISGLIMRKPLDNTIKTTIRKWKFADVGTPGPTAERCKAAIWPGGRVNKHGEVPVLAIRLPVNIDDRDIYGRLPNACFVGFTDFDELQAQEPAERTATMLAAARFSLVSFGVIENILKPYTPRTRIELEVA
jgi:hypothetical protein